MKLPKYLPEVNNSQKVAGVDGCKNGWVLVRPDGDGSYRWKARRCFKQLMEEEDNLELVLVDMPIGLTSKEAGGKFQRKVDDLLRSELKGTKKSSVFNAPCREAVQLSRGKELGYIKEEAREKNKAIDKEKRSLSEQSLHLMGKIDELDAFLQNKSTSNPWITESHPELAFQLLNGNKPLSHKKPVDKGIEERLELLGSSDLKRLPGNLEVSVEMSTDDLVDALSLCHVAKNGVREGFSALRNEPDHPDAAGIPIELLFPRSS